MALYKFYYYYYYYLIIYRQKAEEFLAITDNRGWSNINNFISERVIVHSSDLLSRVVIGHDSTPWYWQALSTYQIQNNRFGCEPPNFAKDCVKRFKQLTLTQGVFIVTQLNSTRRRVEFSWVQLCRYKHPLRWPAQCSSPPWSELSVAHSRLWRGPNRMHLDFFSHLSLCPGIIAHVHKQTILSVCDGSLDTVVLLVLVFFFQNSSSFPRSDYPKTAESWIFAPKMEVLNPKNVADRFSPLTNNTAKTFFLVKIRWKSVRPLLSSRVERKTQKATEM